jgi:hypothetical protein
MMDAHPSAMMDAHTSAPDPEMWALIEEMGREMVKIIDEAVEEMEAQLRIITLEELAAVQDVETELVPVPEWGERAAVKIRGLTKAAQNRVRAKAILKGRNGQQDQVDQDKLDMYMLLEGMVEPALAPKDFDLLRRRQAGVIDRILLAICRLSGMTTGADLAQQAVEDAEALFPPEE